MTDFESVKDYLKSEFEFRVKKNPRYSLRSFAQYLKINPAELSQVFHGKRRLSAVSAVKVAKSLGLNAQETKHLLWLLQSEKNKKAGLNLDFQEPKLVQEINLELFAKVSNWYHFAILNIIDMKNFIWSAREISKQLGIGQSEAQIAMNDLIQTGLVKIEERSKKISARAVEVKSQIPSHSIRKYHRQMIERAMLSLDEVSIENREFQGVGFVINPESIPAIKNEIRQFSQYIANKFHKVSGQSVYQIEICLFPITKEPLK